MVLDANNIRLWCLLQDDIGVFGDLFFVEPEVAVDAFSKLESIVSSYCGWFV